MAHGAWFVPVLNPWILRSYSRIRRCLLEQA